MLPFLKHSRLSTESASHQHPVSGTRDAREETPGLCLLFDVTSYVVNSVSRHMLPHWLRAASDSVSYRVVLELLQRRPRGVG